MNFPIQSINVLVRQAFFFEINYVFFCFFFCYSTNITVEFPERVVSYVMVVVKNPKTEAKLQVCMYLLGMYVSFLYVFSLVN